MLDVSRAFAAAWKTFGRHWQPLVLAMAALGAVTVLVALLAMAPMIWLVTQNPAALGAGGMPLWFMGWQAGIQVVFWPVTTFLMVGILRMYTRADRGRTPRVREVFSGQDLLLPAMACYGLFMAGYGLGATLCVIPGLWFLVVFAFSFYYLVDRELDPYAALLASAEATRGQRWKVALALLLSVCLYYAGIFACGIGLLVAVPLMGLYMARVYAELSDGLTRCPGCRTLHPRGSLRCATCGLTKGRAEAYAACVQCSAKIPPDSDPCPECAEPAPLPAPAGLDPSTAEPTRAEPAGALPAGAGDAVAVKAEAKPASELRCPFCHETLRESAKTERCEDCGAAHHASCWEESAQRCSACRGATESGAGAVADAEQPGAIVVPARPPGRWQIPLAVLVLAPVMAAGGSPFGAIQWCIELATRYLSLPMWFGFAMAFGLFTVPSLTAFALLRGRYVGSRGAALEERWVTFGATERWRGVRVRWKDVEGFRLTGDGVMLTVRGQWWTRWFGPVIRSEGELTHQVVVSLEERKIFNLAGAE
jgi:hypothetical protein